MAINSIFENIYKLTHEDGQNEFISFMMKCKQQSNIHNVVETNYDLQYRFLQKIITEVDRLGLEMKNNNTLLVSVRNQKLLRTCFQLVTSLGISTCLIPGLGVSLHKRCASATVLPHVQLTDEQKYIIISTCTDFFTRSYEIPVLKNIITTFHLSDYLAALMQLSFAPLKKPGIYENFTMTEGMYEKLNTERHKYMQIYEYLVANCFQPTLMKELLVLQSVTEPAPPVFVKRVITKEMSRRLLVPGGLLSLIRCFIETYEVDTGSEWKKVDMICKIISTKHGCHSQETYLNNICTQLTQILLMYNISYITIAVSCILRLHESHPDSTAVKKIVEENLVALSIESLAQLNLPGTILLSPQEIEHKVNILHACTTSKLDAPVKLIFLNLYLLFLLGVKCSKNEEMKLKLKEIILKCLEQLDKNQLTLTIKRFLFGHENPMTSYIVVEELETSFTVKCTLNKNEYCKSDATVYFLHLFDGFADSKLIENVFELLLLMVIELSSKRNKKVNELLAEDDDNIVILDEVADQYASVLQVLSEISTTPKVISAFRTNPSVVLSFIEHFIFESQNDSSDECLTISLVLLNTILSDSNAASQFSGRFNKIIPILKKFSENVEGSNFSSVLCKEALSLISLETPQTSNSLCGKAISEVFDHLLPVRAHGVIELTKLIEAKDPEVISKKHYLFCLFQEQLHNSDSYLYLSAINGIASLGTHCTEDVLQVLCNEFLQVSPQQSSLDTKIEQNKTAELRLKIGDIIVKVTKRLGEMAIVHKALLLNTMLCGCRDEDPLIRTSALSNLAEILLVLHYKIGTIIYEVLLCVWSILESDKAIECKRSAVMVIASLLKGLGKEMLIQLKENLLPIYRTLKNLYKNEDEDTVVRLHAQLALEELDSTVKEFLLPELKFEKHILVSNVTKPADIVFK